MNILNTIKKRIFTVLFLELALVTLNSASAATLVDETVQSQCENPSFSFTENQIDLIPQEAKKVILHLNLFGPEDNSHGEPEEIFANFKKTMKVHFPECPIRSVVASNSEDLKKQLEDVLETNEVISHLAIRGHGYSFPPFTHRNGVTLISSAIEINSQEIFEIGYPLQPVDTTSADEMDLLLKKINARPLDTLSGIRGRFSPDAKILISSCNLLEGTEQEALSKALGISYVLNFKSGSLYANKTFGSTSKNFFMNPKVLMVSFGLGLGSQLIGFSPTSSVMIGLIPFAYLSYRDRYLDTIWNRGYHCCFSDDGTKIWPCSKKEFEKDHFLK